MINNSNSIHENYGASQNIIFQANEERKEEASLILDANLKLIEKEKPNRDLKIKVTMDGFKKLVAIDHIIRFEACRNYTFIHLQNYTKPVLTSKTLKYYANLFDETSFVRLHSKHLVNVKYVLGCNINNMLILVNGTSLQISRRRLKYVKQVLFSFSI